MLRLLSSTNRGLCVALLRVLCVSGLAVVVVASCTPVQGEEDPVPSEPGTVQPPTNGTLISEASACAKLAGSKQAFRALG